MHSFYLTLSLSAFFILSFYLCLSHPHAHKGPHARTHTCEQSSEFGGMNLTLQHTATHCEILQHTHARTHLLGGMTIALQHTAGVCRHDHRTAAHCSTLQYTATYCNTWQYSTHTCTHTHLPTKLGVWRHEHRVSNGYEQLSVLAF